MSLEKEALKQNRSPDKGVWQVGRGQFMKGLHKGQVQVFSTCPHFNGKPLNSVFGGGSGHFAKMTLRTLNWTIVQQEW